MASSGAIVLLLAWLLGLIWVKPVAAQAQINPDKPCFDSTNLTNLTGGGNRGITNQPVISGNGSRVAFWSVNNLGGGNVDGNIEVFVRDTNNNSLVQLTNSVGSILGGFNLEPSINAAGNRIAFYSDRDLTGQNADGNFEIFLARRANNGTWSITQVTNTQGSANLFPAINAAGDRIAFVSDDVELHNDGEIRRNSDRNFEIFLADVSSLNSPKFRQLTNTGAEVTNDQPVINAAGNRIAFTAYSGQSSQIYVWDEAQGGVARLTQSDNNDQPSISADGTNIVYIATNAADRSRVVLHTLSADGSESRAEVIVPQASNTKYRSPAISGNGQRVVYVAEQGTGQAIQINVLLYDVGSGLSVPISSLGSGTGEQPAISSDGTRVTFVGVQAVGGSLDNAGSDIYLNECPQGDLELEFITPPPSEILAGVDLIYEFRVTNHGPSVARDVFFRSDLGSLPPLPANVDYLLPNNCTIDADDILVCRLGNIAVNGSRTFTFGYDIPSNAELGNLVSEIEVGGNLIDSNPANNSTGRFTTRIFEEAALSLKVTADRNSILAGSPEELTYSLTVKNDGPSQARNVRLTNTLSVGASFVSAAVVPNQPGASCALPVGRDVICELGNLTAGDSISVNIVVKAIAGAPDVLTNVATVSSLTAETDLTDNTVTTKTTVEHTADLSITKVASPDDRVVAGTEITYTLTYTNHGYANASNVKIVDTLPPNVSFVRSVPPAAASCTANGGVVTCTVPGTLVPGATRSFSIVGLVASEAPAGIIINTATITSTTSDPNPANNQTPPVENQVILVSDLTVSKTVNTTTPDVGEVFTYTIYARNSGASLATGVVVTDTLPADLEFISAEATQGAYDVNTGLWTIGALPVQMLGQEEILTITVRAPMILGGTIITNSVSIGGEQPDPPTGLPSEDFVEVTPQIADIQVSKRSTPVSGVRAGAPLTYTVTITNAGPAFARGVQLTDVLPADVFLVSVDGPNDRADCLDGANTITCDVGDMTTNAVVNYTFVVTREQAGTITNTVSVSSLTPDPDLDNNTFEYSTTVVSDVPYRLVMTQPNQDLTVSTDSLFTVIVEIRDRFDNIVTTNPGHNAEISLLVQSAASCTDPADGAPLSGNITNAVNGVATFSSVQYKKVVPAIYLLATYEGIIPDNVLTACSPKITVNPGSMRELRITSAPQTIEANFVSEVITVTRYDAFANETIEGDAQLDLFSSSPIGTFYNVGSNTPIEEITIPDGQSSVGFLYRDTLAGSHTISVTAGAEVTPATQLITVTAGPARSLSVIEYPPTVTAGVPSGAIIVARIDEFGNENSSDDTITVTLESDSPNPLDYQFFDDPDGVSPIEQTQIVSGTSRATVYYRDIRAGVRNLLFEDASTEPDSLTSDTITITVAPAATHHLIITNTPPITTTAGVASQLIHVAREDEFGNRVFAGDLSVTLQSVPLSGGSGSPTFTPDNQITILNGEDSASFQYTNTLAKAYELQASAGGSIIGATQTITVYAGAPSHLAVVTDEQEITAGQVSGEIRIQRRDQYGNPATSSNDLTVNLSIQPAQGAFLPTMSSLDPITQVTIEDTDATVYYTNTVSGNYLMIFDGGDPFTTTQQITVNPDETAKLVFIQVPTVITAGVTSGNFVVERQDRFNNPNRSPSALTVSLATSSLGLGALPTFWANNVVLDPKVIEIPGNSSSVNFQYRDQLAGSPTITATADGLEPATTVVTVNPAPANRLVLSTNPVATTAGITTTQTITVQVRDQFGNAVPRQSNLSVVLSSSTPSRSRFVNLAGTSAINSVLIPVGQSTASFRYYSEVAGTATITATAPLPNPTVNRTVTINAAPVARVRIITDPRTVTAGQISSNITVQLQDQFGNPNTSAVQVVATLSSSSNGAPEFLQAGNNSPLPGSNQNELHIAAQAQQASFRYRDTLAGTHQLTVTSIGLTGDTQPITVLGAAPQRLKITGPENWVAGVPQAITITALDEFDNRSDEYDGQKSLSFSGASPAPNGAVPTVTGLVTLGTAEIPFGTSTTLDFDAGTVTTNMTLYHAENATINAQTTSAPLLETEVGDRLSVTVSPANSSQVRAETVADGSGIVVPAQTITVDQTIDIFAVLRDPYGNFVATAGNDTNWQIARTGGVTVTDISPTSGPSVTFSPSGVGTAVITPIVDEHTSVPTGLITVEDDEANSDAIDQQPDNTGAPDVGEASTLGAVGDTVWLDENRNGLLDDGEGGVPGVTVQLYTADGTLVTQQNTDANGNYLLTDIAAGEYYIEFGSLPGYEYTAPNVSGQGENIKAAVPAIEVKVTADDQKWNYTSMVPWVGSDGASAGSESATGNAGNKAVGYSIAITNTDSSRSATNVVVLTTLPSGATFVAEASSPGWICTESGSCSLTLDELPPASGLSASFVVQHESAVVSAAEPSQLVVNVQQDTPAQSPLFALGPGETKLTLDAGLAPLAASQPDSVPKEGTLQGSSIFLPTVKGRE